MSKKISTLAKELGWGAKDLTVLAQQLGMDKTHWLQEVNESEESLLVQFAQKSDESRKQEELDERRRNYTVDRAPDGRWGVFVGEYKKGAPGNTLGGQFYNETYRYLSEAYMRMFFLIENDKQFKEEL